MAGKRRRTAKNQGISKKAVFILGLFIALCVIGFAYMRQSGEEVITFSTDSAVATSTDADKTDKTEKDDTAKEREKGHKQPKTVKGRLAIVIDDCGTDMAVLEGLNAVPIDLTYAVMPFKSHTIDSAESGRNAGRKIIVHLPMEPLDVPSSEEIFISSDMGDSKIRATMNELIDQVPYAVGINNHQGSKATADSRVMKAVMSVLKKRDLVFLDSRTNTGSVGEETARAAGVATTRNNLFLDNDTSVNAVKERLRQAARMAVKNGHAVAIGHCRENTLRAIRETVDELTDEGIKFVFVTDLM
ncbi:divergent polysaccharide deacetylase family protein [Colibacter massiliensis]|uniref:divergent polysaccharide deacetylase family protein n=1 Tax=Colibacter massiliensis TaxID=1852379 RepID=UPI003F8DEE30